MKQISILYSEFVIVPDYALVDIFLIPVETPSIAIRAVFFV